MVLVCVILEIIGGILAFVYREQVSNGVRATATLKTQLCIPTCVVQIQNGIQRNLIENYNTSTPGAESNRVVDFFQSTVSPV